LLYISQIQSGFLVLMTKRYSTFYVSFGIH